MSKKLKAKPKMTWTQQLWLQSYLHLALHANYVRDNLVDALKKLRVGLASESTQTKEMLRIYKLQRQGLATAKEIKYANRQFRSLLKNLGLGVIIVLPFSPITLPLIVRLGRRLGVEVLPDSWKDVL